MYQNNDDEHHQTITLPLPLMLKVHSGWAVFMHTKIIDHIFSNSYQYSGLKLDQAYNHSKSAVVP